MSFWDSIKKVAVSTKCLAGMHSGEFEPAIGKPACNLVKVCLDCNKNVEKINHKFGKFQYNQDSKCDGKFVCVHCQEEEAKVKHQWATEFKGCSTYQRCSRCNTREHVSTKHTWHAGVCNPNRTQTFFCSGCDATERRPIDYENLS